MELPELYAGASPFQKRDAVHVLTQYLPQFDWAEGDAVLDFGCGDGDLTEYLARCIPRCASLTGIDISKKMIDYARCHHQERDLRLGFQQVDIMKSIDARDVFPDGFDKIFSFYCLHWIKDHQRLMEHMYDILKPGGDILLVFLASNPIFTMYERMAERTEWAEYMKDVAEYVPHYQYAARPAEMFASICRSVGLQVVECTAQERSFSFQNINIVKNAVAAVNPFLRRVPVRLRESYLLDCLMELQKLKAPSADDTTVARYRLMIAHVRKP
ncbi:farnesoic acid O-methyltransferase [Daphnia sinensis]|uniref:Farnesoic acid O-methyltransferase n=1 Tax=Daphnia sinensis TaxID=1820382 RepID=A0AAD5L3T5_9CRUS|nr:farnesoic acid O-methyltransferase [Daphnia sinensis]